MRPIPDILASRLSGATTLCHCWRLLLRDGTVQGYTDHDVDLTFNGVAFAAGTGLSAGSIESDIGFAVGGGEVTGALNSAAIDEADIANGRYDGATVESWLVDWTDTDARLLLDTGVIGEVKRTEFAFTAEVRSIANDLDQPFGRYFQSACAADLGDGRCGVDISQPAFRATATIAATDGRLSFTLPIANFADAWFSQGVATFNSGANTGQSFPIKGHTNSVAGATIALWTPLGGVIAIGDSVTLVAGCDKRMATCNGKFNNVVNFRGFAQIPGIDVLLSYANANTPAMDGGSLFR